MKNLKQAEALARLGGRLAALAALPSSSADSAEGPWLTEAWLVQEELTDLVNSSQLADSQELASQPPWQEPWGEAAGTLGAALPVEAALQAGLLAGQPWTGERLTGMVNQSYQALEAAHWAAARPGERLTAEASAGTLEGFAWQADPVTGLGAQLAAGAGLQKEGTAANALAGFDLHRAPPLTEAGAHALGQAPAALRPQATLAAQERASALWAADTEEGGGSGTTLAGMDLQRSASLHWHRQPLTEMVNGPVAGGVSSPEGGWGDLVSPPPGEGEGPLSPRPARAGTGSVDPDRASPASNGGVSIHIDNVNNNADIDYLLDEAERRLLSQLAAGAEGVHR